MDHDKLNQLLRLVEGTSITEIEYSEGDWRVKLVRGSRSGLSNSEAPMQPLLSTPVDEARVESPSAKASSSTQHRVITAGLTGTFYRTPAPDQPPFVSIGDVIQEGQTVAVVEAMKLLNAIEADCSGRLAEIFADDGTTVTPDTKLFAIEPLEAANV
ncbi:acetyl-CoA carboxylase biotin carboxyl carrier protein [Paraburkholderia caledonica]|uniref:Biotin carboxyl carrier protein of acetyl-CoA carboxylase n=1 Tax=Paraburkholderia caledonica TaxID=134536 RepID=A0AB73ITC8_9BURK|nr:acetyl-CoA carboxylase biotin carboxyl carrier protein [Paraburkholderia caledonica]